MRDVVTTQKTCKGYAERKTPIVDLNRLKRDYSRHMTPQEGSMRTLKREKLKKDDSQTRKYYQKSRRRI